VSDRPTATAGRTIAFGPFRILPAQLLLLEGEIPVRLGSRAFDILIALVERAGGIVEKNELIARIWPNTFVDENTLRVHVAGLRRALGDGQPGRRYVTAVPGRGYRFVAPVDITDAGPALAPARDTEQRTHNLPMSQARAIGREKVVGALGSQLIRHRFVTIVGAGGIGKTTAALTLAETLLPAYEDGIRFVDLAPVSDPQFVPSTLGNAIGVTVHLEGQHLRLVDHLRDKRMLIVLDSCEHVTEMAAALAEQILAGAPGVHILATSREPLRAEGERVHRLTALECPRGFSALTAAEALAFPAVRLFVERANAIMDGYELTDADAPIVADICGKLGGVALAIELAAARIDAFGIRQLSTLLDDRFSILNQGRRTAQPRHRSLTATLDWSYEFLPENERALLRRLSVFAGPFTLESAVAVAGNDDTNVVDTIANLVAKSLVAADLTGATVDYRLLGTTRAYTTRKLVDSGEFQDYARQHAIHQLDWFRHAETDWRERTRAEWLIECGRRVGDLRAALNWAFSSNGDISIAASLTAASSALWPAMAPAGEFLEYVERALASRKAGSTITAQEEARLLRVLAGALLLTRGPHPFVRKFLVDALEVAEKADDLNGRIQALLSLAGHCLYAGNFREAASLAERCREIGDLSTDVGHRLIGAGVAAPALYCLGDFAGAQRHIDSILNHDVSSGLYWLLGYRLGVQHAYSKLLWVQGFPEKAIRSATEAYDQAEANGNPVIRMNALVEAACAIALKTGDLSLAESRIETLLVLATENALPVWNAHGHCLKGMLLLARGDEAGRPILEKALDWLREANFAYLRATYAAALAHGLSRAGNTARACAIIDETIEQANRNEEYWCMAELLRIKGEIIRLDGSANCAGDAENCFLQALALARQQETLSWELRAATSLARLRQHQGRATEGAELLSGVYDRFTEGFGTADLRAARALIGELRR
jgi:predicted ATPase/DNA-binding winged helix-turn-helix (wHTH) protein